MTFSVQDMLNLSRYLLVFGILIDFLNAFTCIFLLFLRRNVMLKNQGIRCAISVTVIIVLLAFAGLSILAYTEETMTLWLGAPLFMFSLVSTLTIAWLFTQTSGITLHSMEILEALVGVIEAGDQNLEGHSLHVQNLSILIYNNLPFRKRISINSINLQYASLLLDIGKLGIPRAIIHKAGKLERDEWELVRRHPEISSEILQPVSSFKMITEWIKYHHERVDGTGYYHLKGNEIPLASRILAVADTYSAITMDRSYRPALPHENALAELRLVAGTQLDPEIVEIFCSIPPKKILDSLNDIRKRMNRYQSGDFRR